MLTDHTSEKMIGRGNWRHLYARKGLLMTVCFERYEPNLISPQRLSSRTLESRNPLIAHR